MMSGRVSVSDQSHTDKSRRRVECRYPHVIILLTRVCGSALRAPGQNVSDLFLVELVDFMLCRTSEDVDIFS